MIRPIKVNPCVLILLDNDGALQAASQAQLTASRAADLDLIASR